MIAPARLGRYEIVRPIGKSMTDVYLAIDTVENRKAALKLIRPDEDSTARLVMEAERRGAAIQKEIGGLDPRVVEIYDFGDLDGYFFVAMQYVEGRTLAEVLEADAVVDTNRAAVIALEICEQLAKFHAWQSAVVHGDIKPSNIHLGPNDTVRLLDFGIAKTLRASGDATMHHFGSPSYCAPERLTRSQVDEQSDLWALGATLYEMLMGVPPYRAQDTHKLENLIRSKRPPRALPASCPRGLRAIVTKALAPDPVRRYETAAAMQADLQAFLEHGTTAAEIEQRASWKAGATIVAAREALRKATRTLVRVRRTLKLAGAVLWFLVGMALSIGGIKAWWMLRDRPVAHAAPATSTVRAAATKPNSMSEVPGLYTAEAERILSAYRESADPALDDFDWYKSEILLEHAVRLGDLSSRTRGELALAKGYGTLARLAAGTYSEAAVGQLSGAALDDFAQARAALPSDAMPHLALACYYVYTAPDLEKAMTEFAAGERLGAALGRREIEQKADGYRLRAQREAARQPQQAWRDVREARALYERIPGFDQADMHVKELARIRYGTTRRTARPVRRTRWR
ncbi:MAG TPA: serine/threonine-protein kinase [Bryobacteraceae bacterium]|nr:serine/threonine-protein kinase [Bryobacteraceae bacterium]